MSLNICIAGATGWAGSALSKGVHHDEKLNLVSGISRSSAGKDLSKVLNLDANHIPVFENVEQAFKNIDCDILVEYTDPSIAKENVLHALKHNINVVIGTSGLTNADYQEIEEVALKRNCSVLAVGNFAITVVLLQKFSEIAAEYLPDYEIIDYASDQKKDAPSGTAHELAHRLAAVQKPNQSVSEEEFQGIKESRGASLEGVNIHSVRLPGYVISVESIFGATDEQLTIRHDSGSSAEPYVQGGLLAIKNVETFKGLKRGLDSVMEL